MTDITNDSEESLRPGSRASRSLPPAGLAAGLCAVALLLGPGLRASNAEDAGTSAIVRRSEVGSGTRDCRGRQVEIRRGRPSHRRQREGRDARGVERTAAARGCRQGPKYGGRYFVDFRARTAASYGHAFLWYGTLKEDGKVGAIEVAGLHPATDSVVPYILGHIIPVPSETGKSYGDLDEQYLTASYRVYLTDAQAKHVFAYIKQKQANSPLWQAGTVNCTGFISDVASYMGLRTPAVPTLMYPEDLVKAIKKLNGGRQEVPAFASLSH